MSTFKLEVYKTFWGVPHYGLNDFQRLKDEGIFTGVEQGLIQLSTDDKVQFLKLVKQHNFKFIAMIYTSGNSVEEHVDSFRRQYDEAIQHNPVLINSHSGLDSWTFQESEQFFAKVLEIERESTSNIPVCHETHRGKVLYNPWVTRDLLQIFPDLKLCADLSHWVVVCQRLIDDESILKLVAERTIHIHARVGYEHGPQVNDPRASENLKYVQAYENWWDLIWESQKQRGFTVTTLNPEYGPPLYMHVMPHTNTPVADQWEVQSWQAKRELSRFEKKYSNKL